MRDMPAELRTQTKEFTLDQRIGNMAPGFSKTKSHKGTYIVQLQILDKVLQRWQKMKIKMSLVFGVGADGRLQDLHRDGNSPVPALFVFTSPSISPNNRGEYQSTLKSQSVIKTILKKRKKITRHSHNEGGEADMISVETIISEQGGIPPPTRGTTAYN